MTHFWRRMIADCCWKDACLIFGGVLLDAVWMYVTGSRLNVKYFDKDNETGLCHCRLFWLTSAPCDDHCVQSFYLLYIFQNLAVSHLKGRGK